LKCQYKWLSCSKMKINKKFVVLINKISMFCTA
jgi:hypothetical protein